MHGSSHLKSSTVKLNRITYVIPMPQALPAQYDTFPRHHRNKQM